jgi:HSP20 family protein
VAFVRWDPFRDLLAVDEQIGPLLGSDAPGWSPPVDLYESAGEFVLTAELPGLTRDEIEIHAERDRIVIRGERAGEVCCEQYHRVERGHGRFSRAFVLSEAINIEGIAADLKDGVLTIRVPKASASGHIPRRVTVT